MHPRKFPAEILGASWTWVMLLLVQIAVDPAETLHWKSWARRQGPTASRKAHAVPISYRLDAWSQYDNPEEGSAREGDITDPPLSRKTATRDLNLLWTGGKVRYFVDESILREPAKFSVLEDAMATIMQESCIRFERIFPNAYGEFPHSEWVNITGNQKGCFSDLGRLPVGASNLNLDVERCFRTRGHALHEILHTLGVYHEHMRPDRDDFINILWDNIRDGVAFNFRILEDEVVTNYGLPYDYDSIMHYSMTAFSKDKSVPTIVPVTRDVEIGQRDHLSLYDIQKLMITYKCNDKDSDLLNPQIPHDHRDHHELIKLNSTNALEQTRIADSSDDDDYDYRPILQPRILNPQMPHDHRDHHELIKLNSTNALEQTRIADSSDDDDYDYRPILQPRIIRPNIWNLMYYFFYNPRRYVRPNIQDYYFYYT